MSGTLCSVTLAGGGDISELRVLARQLAADYGLSERQQALVAVGATEAASGALRRAGAAVAEFRFAEAEERFEVVVQDARPPDAAPGTAATNTPCEEELALVRRCSEVVHIERNSEARTVITMGWARPPRAVPLAPDFTTQAMARTPSPDLLELWRKEDRALVDVLEEANAELEAKRGEIAALAIEFEDTNRGIVALHAELEAAREAEARLAAIVRSSDDAIFSLLPERVVATWNAGAEELLGHAASEIVGRPVETLVPEESRGEFDASLRRLENGEHVASFDAWWRRREGSQVEAAATISAMRDATGQLIGYAAVLRDLTERRQAEEELAAARGTEEVFADRDRIARDLHDLVIQRLFASGMSLQATTLQLAGHPALVTRLVSVIDDLDATITEIRSTIFALGHGPHQASSVRSQLLDLSSEATFALGFAPRVRFVGPVDTVVPDAVADHVRAVLREALSNVARHAQASIVDVSIQVGEDLVLVVKDDGRGIGSITRTSGITNMGTRAEALGGTFEVQSEVGAGTRLEWRVPLSR